MDTLPEDGMGGRPRRWPPPVWAGLVAAVALVGLAALGYQWLQPAAPRPTIVTGAPSSPSAPTVTAISPATVPGMTTCPVSYGVTPTSPLSPAPSALVPRAVPAGATAFEGTMVLVGPAGWECEAVAFADGGLQQVVHPPGEALPAGNLEGNTTATAQAIIAWLPAPTDGPGKSLACPYLWAAGSDAQKSQLPCGGLPKSESVTQLDANSVLIDDPPGTAGAGAMSGGANPTQSLVFYSPLTQAAGIVTCVLPAALQPGCAGIMADFRSRYAPRPAVALSGARAPACNSAQLRAADGGANGGGGTTVREVTLTNVGAVPCLLSGLPTSLAGVRVDGHALDLRPSSFTYSLGGVGPYPPTILMPGESGGLGLATTNVCTGEYVAIPGTFPALRIGLPGGGTVSVTGRFPYSFTCGALAGTMGIPTSTALPRG